LYIFHFRNRRNDLAENLSCPWQRLGEVKVGDTVAARYTEIVEISVSKQ